MIDGTTARLSQRKKKKKEAEIVRTSFFGKPLEETPAQPEGLCFWARYNRWKLLVIPDECQMSTLS
jgi:hypothetical protein